LYNRQALPGLELRALTPSYFISTPALNTIHLNHLFKGSNANNRSPNSWDGTMHIPDFHLQSSPTATLQDEGELFYKTKRVSAYD
jgi:hypothetical protein